ncbi:MAG: hypothetical protein MUF45_14935 [Spirosomaceae bacterium]|jgi:tetratricopeptide (TPR) repeat protein|nr:hypothetical protein [Spirosomataceae bacterium]
MKKTLLKSLLAFGFVLNISFVNACTIFIANDGKNVWVGNNEDEYKTKQYKFWYFAAHKGRYGYVLWSEKLNNRLLNKLTHKFPQGGMNQYGLFMDYTAIEEIEIKKDQQKKDRKKEVVNDVLSTCQTVEEALRFIEKYNLVKLKSAQLFIADATGNYATITGGYVVLKKHTSFALTNYRIDNNYKEQCHRRDVAMQYLSATQNYDLDYVTKILEKSSQKNPNNLVTNYSMAIDLINKKIHLFQKNDFTTVSLINLEEELSKANHHRDLEEYFPKNIKNVLTETYSKENINTTIEKYQNLHKQTNKVYNFDNDDALNWAIGLIGKGKVDDAIKFLEVLSRHHPNKLSISTWLGVAYRRQNEATKAKMYFDKVMKVAPDDYLLTLFGKQENGKVVFRLPDFEGAERVSLIGEFSDWRKNAIKMNKENGFWVCEVTLPQGEHTYKFLVNGQSWADSQNYLHEVDGTNIFSKLYVW